MLNKKDKVNRKNIKDDKKTFIATIFILIFIGLIAFISIGYKLIFEDAKIGYVSLSPIDVTIPSEDEEHSLSIKITLGLKNKNLNKLNIENVQRVTKEAIKQLDYEKISKKNGNEYIKDVVLNMLNQEFDDSIEEINLDGILRDIKINEENPKSSARIRREEYLKGLKWSK